MRKIKGYVQLSGFPQDQKFSFDVPDDTTDEEIEKLVQETVLEEIYCGWWEVEEDEGS